jgi:FMN-dependent NADH-azoreductase
MSKLLRVDSSGKGPLSVTRSLTEYFAEKWSAINPGGEVIYRDLMQSHLQFVDADIVGALFTPEDKQTHDQQKILAASNSLISELLAAEIYVFGVPMYNFGIPAVFKAYIDLVIRAGKTFSYEGGTPKGLLLNKKLIVISASGGDYQNEPGKSFDFVEPYLRAVKGFVGVKDITFIRAHGIDPETISKTTRSAKEAIDALLKPVAVR